MDKTNSHIVPDLYKMLCSQTVGVPPEEEAEIIENMANNMKQIMKETFSQVRDTRKVRLSSVGKPDRRLWHEYHNPKKVEASLDGPTRMRFLYGHFTEEMVLALVKLTGHAVTDEQKVVQVAGVTGHMDCKINGIVVDVKSASAYGFRKFKNNTLHLDDPYGYIGQNKSYAHAEGDKKYGWLAFDKANGELAYLEYDETLGGTAYADAVDYDIVQRVKDVKKLLGFDASPEALCSEPVNDGKTANMKLAVGCTYCPFKADCFPGLRTFLYAGGPKYLTTVVTLPRVAELTDEF